MSTTTIRLPEELKSRVARAAAHAGTTSHNFIVEAIAEKTGEAEQRAEFLSTAEERYQKFLASGKAIPWDEMRSYLLKRATGLPAKRPVARNIAPKKITR